MSTTEMNAVFGVTHATRVEHALGDEAATGDVMMVLERLIFSSSSRACVCANCARARSSCATAA